MCGRWTGQTLVTETEPDSETDSDSFPVIVSVCSMHLCLVLCPAYTHCCSPLMRVTRLLHSNQAARSAADSSKARDACPAAASTSQSFARFCSSLVNSLGSCFDFCFLSDFFPVIFPDFFLGCCCDCGWRCYCGSCFCSFLSPRSCDAFLLFPCPSSSLQTHLPLFPSSMLLLLPAHSSPLQSIFLLLPPPLHPTPPLLQSCGSSHAAASSQTIQNASAPTPPASQRLSLQAQTPSSLRRQTSPAASAGQSSEQCIGRLGCPVGQQATEYHEEGWLWRGCAVQRAFRRAACVAEEEGVWGRRGAIGR